MFEFLKNFTNDEKSTSTNDVYSVHRVLKTDIKKNPNPQEDEILFGCGCFWGAEKCFWKLPGVVTTSCLLYTSPSPRDATLSRMPSSA